MKYTLDTSVIIKGLVKPRRKKQDHLLGEQIRIYEVASSIMDDVYNKKIDLSIPIAAIIEVASVSSRLTGIKSIGIETAGFINSIATEIIDEGNILQQCIDVAATTKISGFDSIFITCAKITDSTLITDDKKMYESAVKIGVKVKLLDIK